MNKCYCCGKEIPESQTKYRAGIAFCRGCLKEMESFSDLEYYDGRCNMLRYGTICSLILAGSAIFTYVVFDWSLMIEELSKLFGVMFSFASLVFCISEGVTRSSVKRKILYICNEKGISLDGVYVDMEIDRLERRSKLFNILKKVSIFVMALSLFVLCFTYQMRFYDNIDIVAILVGSLGAIAYIIAEIYGDVLGGSNRDKVEKGEVEKVKVKTGRKRRIKMRRRNRV